MKESIGYTVTLNIMIVFITIVVGFLCAALIYFKSNKVSNIITTAIEKYEGYNTSAINEINRNLRSIGYGSHAISCDDIVNDKVVATAQNPYGACNLVSDKNNNSYCVYKCLETNGEYYFYKIRTNMMLNVPIINDILDIPIYSNTNRLYDFK
jgi:hypothetical protein